MYVGASIPLQAWLIILRGQDSPGDCGGLAPPPSHPCLDGGEAVRHHHGGSADDHAVQGILHDTLRLGVLQQWYKGRERGELGY